MLCSTNGIMTFVTLSKTFLLASILSYLRKSKSNLQMREGNNPALFFWQAFCFSGKKTQTNKPKTCYECHLFIPSEVKQNLLLIWNSNWFTVSMKWHVLIFLLSATLNFQRIFISQKIWFFVYFCNRFTRLYVLFSRCARGTGSTYFITFG